MKGFWFPNQSLEGKAADGYPGLLELQAGFSSLSNLK
jgi:hypothetical protein